MLSRIKSARIEAGLRAKLVAQAYGISSSLISLWESGKRPLNREREKEILAVIVGLSRYVTSVRSGITRSLPSFRQVGRQAVAQLRRDEGARI